MMGVKIQFIQMIMRALNSNDESLCDVEKFCISEDAKNTIIKLCDSDLDSRFEFTGISYGCYHPLVYTKNNIYFLVYEDGFGTDGVHKGSYCRIECMQRNPE